MYIEKRERWRDGEMERWQGREGGMVESYGESRKRRWEGEKEGGREERDGMKKKNGRS